jgi:Skp family chaperone for outer membrane proteins
VSRFLRACLAALIGLVLCQAPLARAQSGTVAGSGAQDFESLVDQDVAAGYYSAAQGEQLKSEFEAAQSRLDASLEKAQAAVQKTVSLTTSGNQQMFNQLGSLSQDGKTPSLGGSPDQIQEQAQAIYSAAHVQTELAQAVIDDIQPAVQDIVSEVDQIIAQRAALINGNPSVSSTIKHNVNKESSTIHDVSQNGITTAFNKITYQIQNVQGQLDSNKDQIISQIQTTITQNSQQYGPDPTKWPKPPTKTASTPTTPTNANTPPQTTVAQNQTQPPSSSGKTTTPQKGTVPSNQPDPAFSVTRNGTQPGVGQNGQAGQGGQGGNGNGSKPASGKNGSSGSSQTASNASQNKTPPPNPANNPLNQLKQTKIQPLPIAQPYNPVQLPPKYQINDPGYVYNAPQPEQGNSVNIDPNGPPPTSAQPPVIAPGTPGQGQDTGVGPQGQPWEIPMPSYPDQPPPPSNSTSSAGAVSKGVNPNTQTTAATDDAFNAYRNYPNGVAPPAPQNPTPDTGAAAASAAAAAAAAAMNGDGTPNPNTPGGQGTGGPPTYGPSDVQDSTVPNTQPQGPPAPDPNAPPQSVLDALKNMPKGNMHLVDGDNLDDPSQPSLSADDLIQDVTDTSEYGDTISTASLLPIYAGYNLNDQQGDAMMSLDLQVQTPSSVMTVPSNQIQVPSYWGTVPSSQVNTPGVFPGSDGFDDSLCGR